MYADDIALWSPTKRLKKLNTAYACRVTRRQFQSNVDQIVHYMTANGFDFSPDKTSFVVFNAGRKKILKSELYITVQGQQIKPVKVVKYLGVSIDESFTWRSHVNNVIEKTNSAWNLLKILRRTPGCNNTRTLLHVTKALVRSRLSYGQEAYFSAAESHIQKLESRECGFLRMILGLARHTPRDVVYKEAAPGGGERA